MANFAATLVLLIIVGSAVFYIIKSKKRGVKCIGCPSAVSCGKNVCNGCCNEK